MAALQKTQPAMKPEPSSGATELGAMLREARQSLKRELSDISDELRIKLAYLQAIEDGRLDDLPGPAYAVGFLRGYASYLGLDAEDIVNRFKAAGAVKGDRTELHLPSPVTDGRLPSAAVLVAAAALAVCVYGAWYYVSSSGKAREDKVASVPSNIADTVGNVPARSPADRNVGAAPAEAAPAAVEPPARNEVPEPAPAAAPPARPAVEAKPPVPAMLAVPKPQVEARPLQPVALARVSAPVVEPPAAPILAAPSLPAPTQPPAPQTATVAPTPPVVAPPARSRAETRRETPRSEPVPPPAAPETRTNTASGQDGSLPWLAPTDNASAPRADANAARSVRGAADAKTRPQTAAARPDTRANAAPRAATPSVLAPASTGSDMARPADELDASGSVTTLQPADEQVAMARVAEGGRRISIHAKFDTWVEVRRGGGAPVFSKLMKAGETFEVPAQPGYKLSTGNAAGIDLLVDGQRLSPLGKAGAVKKNIALEPDALLKAPGVAP